MDLAKVLLIVRWLLGKGDVLPQLLGVWERFQAADTISEYFAVGEELCRILSVESADFPDLTTSMSAEDTAEFEEAMKAEADAKGISIVTIIAIAKFIYDLWKARQPQA